MVGMDVSLETARSARRRLKQTGRGWNRIAVSDARRQAFKSQVFDEILSNSTLDHFLESSGFGREPGGAVQNPEIRRKS